jgi:hypothetical protein
MAPSIVDFIDTSILVELLDLPQKASRHSDVVKEVKQRSRTRTLILPTATVIETGNHICGLSDGRERRDRATKFSRLLEMSVRGLAPWTLHRATWDEHLLMALRDGASTGSSLIEHATQGTLGAGDLSIIAERNLYRSTVSTQALEVRVWTLDAKLDAYAN